LHACLLRRGFVAARPAVDPLWGLKTNAPVAEVVRACREASALHQTELKMKAEAKAAAFSETPA
jgi:hypothetical protein